MRERRLFNTRSLAQALLEPSKFKCGTFGVMNFTGWSNASWRLVGIKRDLMSLKELGRLSTLTKESNWEGLRPPTIFLWLKVPTHKQTRLRSDRSNRK